MVARWRRIPTFRLRRWSPSPSWTWRRRPALASSWLIAWTLAGGRGSGVDTEAEGHKDEVYAQIARISKAVAAPQRLELPDLLSKGPRTVEDLADLAAITVGNASQHLKILRAARLVSALKQGLDVEYRLADEEVARFFVALRTLDSRRRTRRALAASACDASHLHSRGDVMSQEPCDTGLICDLKKPGLRPEQQEVHSSAVQDTTELERQRLFIQAMSKSIDGRPVSQSERALLEALFEALLHGADVSELTGIRPPRNRRSADQLHIALHYLCLTKLKRERAEVAWRAVGHAWGMRRRDVQWIIAEHRGPALATMKKFESAPDALLRLCEQHARAAGLGALRPRWGPPADS